MSPMFGFSWKWRRQVNGCADTRIPIRHPLRMARLRSAAYPLAPLLAGPRHHFVWRAGDQDAVGVASAQSPRPRFLAAASSCRNRSSPGAYCRYHQASPALTISSFRLRPSGRMISAKEHRQCVAVGDSDDLGGELGSRQGRNSEDQRRDVQQFGWRSK